MVAVLGPPERNLPLIADALKPKLEQLVEAITTFMQQIELAFAPIIAPDRDFDDVIAAPAHAIQQGLGIKRVTVNGGQVGLQNCRTVGLGTDGVIPIGHLDQKVGAPDKAFTGKNPDERPILGPALLGTDHCIMVLEVLQGAGDEIDIRAQVRIDADKRIIPGRYGCLLEGQARTPAWQVEKGHL